MFNLNGNFILSDYPDYAIMEFGSKKNLNLKVFTMNKLYHLCLPNMSCIDIKI